MSDEDKTPTDRKSTLELVFMHLDVLSKDTKNALQESRAANIMSGQNNELLKQLIAHSQSSGIVRTSLPYAAALVALVALLRTF